MGNNPSKPEGGVPPSTSAGPLIRASSTHTRKPRRRESLQAVSGSGKTLPANPSESITSATAQPSSQSPLNRTNLHQHLPPSSTPSPPQRAGNREERMGNEQSREKRRTREASRETIELEKRKSEPVKVPKGSDTRRQRGPDSQFEPSGVHRDADYVLHSNLNYPPRLPLPIEEEIHTPGSPIIAPANFSSDLHEDDVDGVIPRHTSVLSSTTVDDDDIGNELHAFPTADGTRRTVPTLIQWKQGGNRVYVTGTFTSWSRKYRMNREGDTHIHSVTIELPPGTHHVKFIADGEMQLSDELPTAVDYTNILVNYIEVSADDIPKPESADKIQRPESLPPGTEAQDHALGTVSNAQAQGTQQAKKSTYWGGQIPRYLPDLDRAEESKRYQRASMAVGEMPQPPSLPLFLGKSILNGTTPMKDDSSVLNMPNHTVLNHLATSSIKSKVLATSVTTRYKRKYVTTIIHKPTEEDD